MTVIKIKCITENEIVQYICIRKYISDSINI